ncbi:unnamed protein product [Lymnaea stagnalis]|uniref:Uncharacterized protein n=1 Tax=Lymnaea stagnalis TaxID=6523 RepID=A0AAV2HUN7_LYMST
MAACQDDMDSLTMEARGHVQAISNEFLCCAICNEQFDRVDKVPITLPCRQSFCRPCLKRTVGSKHRLNCPVCRKAPEIEGGIDALPADFRIMRMLELISNQIKHTCFQHKAQRLNFFCASCKTPICHDCTVIKHPKEEMHMFKQYGPREVKDMGKSKHVIIDILDAFENYEPIFKELEQFGLRMIDALKIKVQKYKDELRELEKMHGVVIDDISKRFDYYRALLKQRETATSRRADTLIREQRDTIERACTAMEKELQSLKILQEQFKIVRVNKDTRLLFKEFHEFEKRKTFFISLAHPELESFFKKFIYTNAKEEELKAALMESVGDVELVKCKDDDFIGRDFELLEQFLSYGRLFNPLTSLMDD